MTPIYYICHVCRYYDSHVHPRSTSVALAFQEKKVFFIDRVSLVTDDNDGGLIRETPAEFFKSITVRQMGADLIVLCIELLSFRRPPSSCYQKPFGIVPRGTM